MLFERVVPGCAVVNDVLWAIGGTYLETMGMGLRNEATPAVSSLQSSKIRHAVQLARSFNDESRLVERPASNHNEEEITYMDI